MFLMVVVVAVVAVVIPVVFVMVPSVIVGDVAPFAFPIALKEAFTVVVRHHPDSARIRWTRPVAIMPLVMVTDRIPVTRNPKETRARSDRRDSNHSRRWGRTNPYPNGDLAVGGASG